MDRRVKNYRIREKMLQQTIAIIKQRVAYFLSGALSIDVWVCFSGQHTQQKASTTLLICLFHTVCTLFYVLNRFLNYSRIDKNESTKLEKNVKDLFF